MSALAEPIADQSQSIDNRIVPPIPESIEETGIPPAIIEHLILKYLYFRGELVGRDIASLLGLQFSLIDELLETLKRQHLRGREEVAGDGQQLRRFRADRSRAATWRANIWKTISTPVPRRCRCINTPRWSGARS